MKILYGIQGTGFGHLSRARALLPLLQAHATVDVLISGYRGDPASLRPLAEHRPGLTYLYNQRGGIDVLASARNLQLRRFVRDVTTLSVAAYDFVLTDFEPITAWAARRAGKRCVGLSHQAAFLSAQTPRPARRSPFAELLFRYFAPCDEAIGLHFRSYDDFIHPPIIRPEVQALTPHQGEHVTVYLPSVHPTHLLSIFEAFPTQAFEVFSPYCTTPQRSGHVQFYPVGRGSFLESLASCRGVITGGGFELCAETMFLGKPLLAVPIAHQYEQACNAAALANLGVTVLPQFQLAQRPILRQWLHDPPTVELAAYACLVELAEAVFTRGIVQQPVSVAA